MNVTGKKLRRLFTPYGRVIDACIADHPYIPITSLGFGFVEMADGADAAIMGLNGATIDGHVLTVTEAETSAKQGELLLPDEFRRLLLDRQRPAREVIVRAGAPGRVTIT